MGMRVIMTDDGLILKSPAGSAHFDLKGRRHTVCGDASFFPEHLRVKDKRKPNLSRVVFERDCTTIYSADGKAKVRIGNWDNPGKPKGWRIKNDGHFISSSNFNVKMSINVTDKQKVLADSSPFSVKDRQVFIKDAFIGNEIKTSVRLSPEMEKAISDVVSATLKKNLQPGGAIWNSLRHGL